MPQKTVNIFNSRRTKGDRNDQNKFRLNDFLIKRSQKLYDLEKGFKKTDLRSMHF